MFDVVIECITPKSARLFNELIFFFLSNFQLNELNLYVTTNQSIISDCHVFMLIYFLI